MGAVDNGPNLEELARRMEALEREIRELREALGNSTSDHEIEAPQQQPEATQAKAMTVASSKTVRDLLLGSRDEHAYSRPLVGVLPSYVVGWLLTCTVAAYGPFPALYLDPKALHLGWLWVGLLAASLFGIYAGVRDGKMFGFGRFQYVGLITAIGTAMVMFFMSLLIVGPLWGGAGPRVTALEWVTANVLSTIAFASVGIWLLFVSCALLGTALQLLVSEKQRGGRAGSTFDVRAQVRTQVWLGFAGTVLAALIGLIGTLIASR